MTDTARKRWESRGFFEKNRDARAFVEDLLDEVDALSARLAQAEQERDELRDFFRDVFDGDPQAFVEGFNDLDEQIRGAEARLREYEEALNLIATGGYGDASIKARIALVSGDTDG